MTGPVSAFDVVSTHDVEAPWRRAVAVAHEVVDDADGPSPRVRAAAARFAAAVAARPDPGGTPRTLRLAEAFVAKHAARDIGITEIAAAACVTPRALQLAFRRCRRTTPLRHLRDVRLAHAHRDLLAGERSSGETVTDVATRWGFANPGRFASYYVEAYGCSPSTTLGRRA